MMDLRGRPDRRPFVRLDRDGQIPASVLDNAGGGGATAAHDVTFTPTGGLSSTDVQAALAELDSEKASGTIPSFASPSIVLGTAAATGAASTVIRSDATIVAFDATSPTTQAFGDAAATGSAAIAARRDHTHAMPAMPVLKHISGGLKYYPIQCGPTTNNQADTLNVLYAAPFYCPETAGYDRIAVAATATVASAVARLGIYADSSGKPGALIVDYGTVAAASSGLKTITISPSVSLTGNTWYWLACVGQTAAPNLIHAVGHSGFSSIGTDSGFSLSVVAGYSQTGVTSGLPDPWGSTLTDNVRVPLIWLRRA